MAKFEYTTLANLANESSAVGIINSNMQALQSIIESLLSRDGLEPNHMEADFDMDGKRIINLPEPEDGTEPLRLMDADMVLDSLDEIAAILVACQEALAATLVAQSAAETAEANAETAETNAETAETNAEAAQVAAEAARDEAVATVAPFTAHLTDTANPHEVTQTQVGLGNVDNTSDLDKPVSTAQQAALDDKADSARTIATQHSLTGGGDLSVDRTLSLVNDEDSPGANKVYGTDGLGARGWKDDPAGGGGAVNSVDGATGDVTIGAVITGATEKSSPVDEDSLALSDSEGGDATKKLTWANIKAALKTYFDTLYYIVGGTDVALADGGTGASLSDPNADRIMFWDDSAGTVTWLTPGTNLSISGTTLNAEGGGGQPIPTNSSYAVGIFMLACKVSSSTASNATAAGSSLNGAIAGSSGSLSANGLPLSGTWRNVSGVTQGTNDFGYWVRVS